MPRRQESTVENAGALGPATSRPVANDIHSQLNPTRLDRVVSADAPEALQAAIREAREEGKAVSIAGGRHAMGGQQFGRDTVLLDMRALNRILCFDEERGHVAVEAGVQWPQLVSYLVRTQAGRGTQWGIIQKQTGADRLTLGGALSANVHGRGLCHRPFIADVECFRLLDAEGTLRTCSRRQDPELFRLAVGGYGLFGPIVSVTLRLARRRKLQRVVEVIAADDLMPAFERRIAEGFLFGDFQYAIDDGSEDFLRRGVLSCYRPVDSVTPVPDGQRELSEADWRRLMYLAHADKRRAFDEYAAYYVSTSEQIYWSDTHQLSLYPDDYHRWLDRELGTRQRATEMISEICVPRHALIHFLSDARRGLRDGGANVIYGTIRLIERDGESFLAWADRAYACVVFNLHMVHSPAGIARAAGAFRRLIDLGLLYGGSYYLTYHRFASRPQVEACYPQFLEFLRLKLKYDPEERFQSDWYRHHKSMFATG